MSTPFDESSAPMEADMRPAEPDAALTAAVAALADPVIAVTTDGIVEAANAAAQRLFPAIRAGNPLLFGLRDPNVFEAIETVLRTQDVRELEFVRRVPDDLAFHLRIAPLATGGALLVFRDMTEARRIERMRSDFVANASHELRTPLAALLGFIETLEGAARDDAVARARFLVVMREQTRRMARLVDDLLSLSRLETKPAAMPQTPLDFAALVREVADTLSVLAREHGVTFKLELPSIPCPVRGERDDLFRVVENLVENAISHGRAGGTVRVRMAPGSMVALAATMPGKQHEDAYVLEVIDDGPGIPAEHLPRLTERFYRVDSAKSRARGGTGLGLSIVKHIVGRHHGRLEIDSTLGHGSCFRVRLPVAQ